MHEQRPGIQEKLKSFTALLAHRGGVVSEKTAGFTRLGEPTQPAGFRLLPSQEASVRNTGNSTAAVEPTGKRTVPEPNHPSLNNNHAAGETDRTKVQSDPPSTNTLFDSHDQSSLSGATHGGEAGKNIDIYTGETPLTGPSTPDEILAQFTEEELSGAAIEGIRLTADYWEKYGLGGDKEPGKRFVYGSTPVTSLGGQIHNMSTLRRVTTGKAEEAKEVIINGQSVEVDSITASRLEDAIRQTEDTVAHGGVIDCFAFSTLLSGQTWGDGKTGKVSVSIDETSAICTLRRGTIINV